MKAVRAASIGRNLHLALYAENEDRLHKQQPRVWPAYGQFKTSSEFLQRCLPEDFLPDCSVEELSGERQPSSTQTHSTSLTGTSTAWCITCDLDTNSAPDTPALFTRNLVGGDSLDSVQSLSATEMPAIKDKFGVVITLGGSATIIDRRNLRQDRRGFQHLFNPGHATNHFLRP